MKALSFFSALAFAASAALAPASAGDDDKKSGADSRLGQEVDRICFQSTINGWRAVKGEDNVVLLERGVNNWYRVELQGACRSSLFRSAIAIGIDSRPGGGCVTRGDRIIVEDSPGFTQSCVITKMYEWDEKASRDDDDDGDDDDYDDDHHDDDADDRDED